MASAEVRLEPVTWENIDDVIAHSESGDGFFPLPHDDDAADKYVGSASNNRRHGRGGLLNAYTAQDVFVGGGQMFDTREVIQLGYWAALDKRRQGFGRAIVQALEYKACKTLPDRASFELEIDERNQPSQALASAMGYAALLTREDGMIIYRKRRA